MGQKSSHQLMYEYPDLLDRMKRECEVVKDGRSVKYPSGHQLKKFTSSQLTDYYNYVVMEYVKFEMRNTRELTQIAGKVTKYSWDETNLFRFYDYRDQCVAYHYILQVIRTFLRTQKKISRRPSQKICRANETYQDIHSFQLNTLSENIFVHRERVQLLIDFETIHRSQFDDEMEIYWKKSILHQHLVALTLSQITQKIPARLS